MHIKDIHKVGLYETHLPVSDLGKSQDFYEKKVGLEIAYENKDRNLVFFWIGGSEIGMLGLWGLNSPWGWKEKENYRCHFAISVKLDDLLSAPSILNEEGIEPLDFYGNPTKEPSVIGWMPSAQVYFKDLDRHLVEFIAILDHQPIPEFGISTWSKWIKNIA